MNIEKEIIRLVHLKADTSFMFRGSVELAEMLEEASEKTMIKKAKIMKIAIARFLLGIKNA